MDEDIRRKEGDTIQAIWAAPPEMGQEGYWSVTLLKDRNAIVRFQTRGFDVLYGPMSFEALNPYAPAISLHSFEIGKIESRVFRIWRVNGAPPVYDYVWFEITETTHPGLETIKLAEHE